MYSFKIALEKYKGCEQLVIQINFELFIFNVKPP